MTEERAVHDQNVLALPCRHHETVSTHWLIKEGPCNFLQTPVLDLPQASQQLLGNLDEAPLDGAQVLRQVQVSCMNGSVVLTFVARPGG